MNVAIQENQILRMYKPKNIAFFSQKSLVDSLVKKVENRFGYSIERLKKKDKHRSVVFARQAVVYLLKKHTLLELEAIGKIINLHYSSVSVAYKRVQDFIEVGDKMALEIQELSDSINK